MIEKHAQKDGAEKYRGESDQQVLVRFRPQESGPENGLRDVSIEEGRAWGPSSLKVCDE